MRRLIERLQARSAEAIDRGAAGGQRQPGHDGHVAGDVQALFERLLRIAEHDVFDLGQSIRLRTPFALERVRIAQAVVPETSVTAYVVDNPALYDRSGNPYAAPDGSLPASFDTLIEETFGDLV